METLTARQIWHSQPQLANLEPLLALLEVDSTHTKINTPTSINYFPAPDYVYVYVNFHTRHSWKHIRVG